MLNGFLLGFSNKRPHRPLKRGKEKMQVVINLTTKVYFSKSDIESIKKTRNAFIDNLCQAKERLKANKDDYNALVDVSFYRLAIRRLNKTIHYLTKPKFKKRGRKKCMRK